LYPNRSLPVPQSGIVCTARSHYVQLSFNNQLTVIGKESDEETFPITETRLKKKKLSADTDGLMHAPKQVR
jgi:hypothetical protein